jgi:hypothetical protein
MMMMMIVMRVVMQAVFYKSLSNMYLCDLTRFTLPSRESQSSLFVT